jgi:hypothetical protein
MNLTTFLALLLPANAFFDIASESGLIEMDMHITQAPKKHLSELGMHLMNLRKAESPPETHDYIEKNLYDYFNIQIFSEIYIGSNK